LFHLGVFIESLLRVILTLVFSYLGAVMALRGKDEFNVIIPYVRFRRQDVKDSVIVLDTSVIIDGRISDIYKTGFLAGRLVVPKFVLRELQRLSDSADDIKRQKGRRGLDLLKLMSDDAKIDLRIREDELPSEREVDAELIRLTKMMEARLCTTDYNLSRTAALQDIMVLNINELANSVKPVVFTGEKIEVRLVKEGKEQGQAVAYLDDGTMVVVGDGRGKIGERARVEVTSVLQTQAGKMIFAKLVN
ncbi:MAG: TRAM domain-containing protein, partial [Candidatus Omnitrophica bacterium]|nr:TRAM domain-containing protein [Candidatus Omnitrophota bacterium]